MDNVSVENGAESPTWGATAHLIINGVHVITTHAETLSVARRMAEFLAELMAERLRG